MSLGNLSGFDARGLEMGLTDAQSLEYGTTEWH